MSCGQPARSQYDAERSLICPGAQINNFLSSGRARQLYWRVRERPRSTARLLARRDPVETPRLSHEPHRRGTGRTGQRCRWRIGRLWSVDPLAIGLLHPFNVAPVRVADPCGGGNRKWVGRYFYVY